MEIDFGKYKSVDAIEDDIKDIVIQGATNVALATFAGMHLTLAQVQEKGVLTGKRVIDRVLETGDRLANARPNEPLARNGLRFVSYMMRTRGAYAEPLENIPTVLDQLITEYELMVRTAKDRIVEHSREIMKLRDPFRPEKDGDVNEILTHCHSSTVERVIINQDKEVDNFKAVCTETRPHYQGRITATNLVRAGVDTTMVADSEASVFIIGRGGVNVDVVLLGCDEIVANGGFINKVGSWQIALSSYYASVPVYVVTPLLKMEVDTKFKLPKIEEREAKEVWEDAPEGLTISNPAFDYVDPHLIDGYLTEFGVIKPDMLMRTVQKEYGWLF